MIIARCAAIAAARVEMAERFARFANGVALVLLLDVHMEGVQVQLECFAADVLEHLESLRGGVDEVGLETVQRFQTDLPPLLLSVSAKVFEMADDRLPLLFVFFL